MHNEVLVYPVVNQTTAEVDTSHDSLREFQAVCNQSHVDTLPPGALVE